MLAANCICNVTGNKSVDKGDKGIAACYTPGMLVLPQSIKALLCMPYVK